MTTTDLVYKEIQTTLKKKRLIRLTRSIFILVGLVLFFYACIYLYAAARITQSKNLGVYPTAQEAAIK